MKKIIIIGAGTFSTVVIDSILGNSCYENYEINGFLDDGKICEGNFDYPLLGKIDDIEKFADENTHFIIAIGNCQARSKISEKYPDINYLTVIDKSANVSEHASIGKGCIILKNTSVNAMTVIGDFSIVNAGAIIDHHCKIGQYCHIGQGVVMWNSAAVESETHLLPCSVTKG